MTLPQRQADAGQKCAAIRSDGAEERPVDANRSKFVTATETTAVTDSPRSAVNSDTASRQSVKDQIQPARGTTERTESNTWLLYWSRMQAPLVGMLSLVTGIFLWHLA